ncbi:FGGY-family carbohydrate kinase [Thiomonas sp. FB-6]|uniref:FGGY-family carbohydrate kinase n=1 Tax=Thiomonas sp. FB-6 TaxID=1158291 RepID=UPI00037EDAAC|nr:FGGY-family carbohydrate kinase [Thiomonas sp. FB-6]
MFPPPARSGISAPRAALARVAAGLDFGTSGARLCVIDRRQRRLFETACHYADARAQGCAEWEGALFQLLAAIPAALRARLDALSLCATSGSVLWAGRNLRPRGPVLMYFEHRPADFPPGHSGPLDGLARLAWLWQELGSQALDDALALHQADWLFARLRAGGLARGGITDWHNALKSGGDPARCAWSEPASRQPFAARLPRIVAPGSRIGRVDPALARLMGLRPELRLVAGTTDANAAFLGSGADRPGLGLSSLGSTLALKLLSPRRIDDARHGVYSHRFGAGWLVSGASQAGGAALRALFDDQRLRELSARIDPERDSPLDLYPLPGVGERFPRADPGMRPRLAPRPHDDAEYLHGLLQGLARIEAQGYARFAELGAPAPREVLSCGGGAANPAWTRLRERMLGCPVRAARHADAALGAARLALLGMRVFPRSPP